MAICRYADSATDLLSMPAAVVKHQDRTQAVLGVLAVQDIHGQVPSPATAGDATREFFSKDLLESFSLPSPLRSFDRLPSGRIDPSSCCTMHL